MSTTEPPSDGHGGSDPMEARLREALIVVADATPIPEPVPDTLSRSSTIAADPRGGRSRPAWRVLAAAAAVVVVIGGAALFGGQRDRTGVELMPGDTTPPSSADAALVSPDHRLSDHWHEAYGFYVCDSFLPPAQDVEEDVLGIHTHGDGIIHIHPFGASSSGANARLGLFGDQVGIEFAEDGWRLPDGVEYRNGSATCGGQPADVVVYRWAVDASPDTDGTDPVRVYRNNFEDIVFDADRQAFTFAVVPEGTVPPRPPTIPTLDNLSDVPTGPTMGTTPN